MSMGRNISIKARQNSLSSVCSSSMESLSSSHAADTCWTTNQELAPTSTAHTIPRVRTKTSDYDTSAAEYDEDRKHSKKHGRIRKAFNRSSKLKKATDKETAPHGSDAAVELMARLALLEERIKIMGEELDEEREHREDLEQKVENLQSENEQLKSEQKVAADQLQSFYKKFFDSINSLPLQLMYNGVSSPTSLNNSVVSKRHSGTSISSMTSQ